MTEDQINAIPRRSASEVLARTPRPWTTENGLLVHVESAMNLEWWRGYYAGQRAALTADKQEGTK